MTEAYFMAQYPYRTMSVSDVHEERIERNTKEVLSTLDRLEDRLDEMKEEREQLLEANQRLVDLVGHLEDQLEEQVGADNVDDVEVRGYEYSFKEGWRQKDAAHRERLDMHSKSEVDVDAIDEQLKEIQKTLRELQRREG